MAAIKEIAEQEEKRMQSGIRDELHLWREGTFLRAYNWSAWLACRFLHEFKLNKRQFKGLDSAVAYIGFPEASLQKWLPEGVTQKAVDEKHLLLKLPDVLFANSEDEMSKGYTREGVVSLTVTDDGGREGISFTVKDSGDGIPKKLQKKVFEALPDTGYEQKRTGLILMVCRTLVRLLEGVIYIDPHYENGTSVVFSIKI